MKKFKIYLDTSFISHLKHEDSPDKMRDTLKLWEDIKKQKYEVFISQLTFDEIYRCYQPKQDILLQHINDIEVTEIKITDDVEELAQIIIETGILKQNDFDDSLHIAFAIVNNCDYIVSWNFKHMVNVNTNRCIHSITISQGYKTIGLIPPTMLLEEGE